MPAMYQPSSRFSSPDVKHERLLVLSGGREPAELFSIRKANMSKTTVRDANVIYVVDAIATDVGLLIVPFSQYRGSNVGLAFAVGGIAGGLGEAVSNKINTVLASKKYDRIRAKEFAAPRAISEIYAHRGEFIPADEIKELAQPQHNTIQFSFRGVRYSLSEKAVDFAALKQWQSDAALIRSRLDGGPAQPGIASLLEWGRRPDDRAHSWTAVAIRETAAGELDASARRIVRSAGVRAMSALLKKLRTLPGDDAQRVVEMLQSLIRQRAGVFAIVSAVSLVLSLIFLALLLTFSPFQAPAQPNDWIGGVSIFPLATLPFVSLGYGIAALWVWSRARV